MAVLKKLKSARVVLTFWYALVLIGGIAVFGLSVYVYLRHLQERSLHDKLVEEVDWIHQLVEIERQHVRPGIGIETLSRDVERRIIDHFQGSPQNFVVVLESDQGQLLYQSPGRAKGIIPLPMPRRDTTFIEGVENPDLGTLKVAVRRSSPFIIQVGFPDTAVREVETRLLTIFGVLAPVVLFLGLAGGWILTGIVLKPLHRITQIAQRITAHNLDERIPERDVNDELGRLITTMNHMIARLQESFGQMREFLMNVAHELRTPLTILKGESELALSRRLTLEESRDTISSHLRESIRMSRIVDDLLMLAKADAGQLAMGHEEVHLNDLLSDIYEDAILLTADQNHSVELGSNPPVTILGDPARLRQLFRILVTNAIQYTDPGGRIRIASRIEGDRVHVAVEDTGIGIPPEDLSQIFNRFYRSDAARDRWANGSGLGLPIAHWIAESHGGAITVTSTVGQGSTFTVSLPLTQAQ